MAFWSEILIWSEIWDIGLFSQYLRISDLRWFWSEILRSEISHPAASSFFGPKKNEKMLQACEHRILIALLVSSVKWPVRCIAKACRGAVFQRRLVFFLYTLKQRGGGLRRHIGVSITLCWHWSSSIVSSNFAIARRKWYLHSRRLIMKTSV